jgi:hypothetical protein
VAGAVGAITALFATVGVSADGTGSRSFAVGAAIVPKAGATSRAACEGSLFPGADGSVVTGFASDAATAASAGRSSIVFWMINSGGAVGDVLFGARSVGTLASTFGALFGMYAMPTPMQIANTAAAVAIATWGVCVRIVFARMPARSPVSGEASVGTFAATASSARGANDLSDVIGRLAIAAAFGGISTSGLGGFAACAVDTSGTAASGLAVFSPEVDLARGQNSFTSARARSCRSRWKSASS